MSVYIKINDNQYAASITGRLNDKDWDNRESKAITLEMSYEDAVKNFADDMQWFIAQDVEETVEKEVEFKNENGEMETKVVTEIANKVETYDNSEYCILGDITVHNDGTVTVKMGKPTAEEQLAMAQEEIAMLDAALIESTYENLTGGHE